MLFKFFSSSNSVFFWFVFFFFSFLGFSRVIKNPACDCPSQFYFISFLFRCVFFIFFILFLYLYRFIFKSRSYHVFFFCFFSSFFHVCCVCVLLLLLLLFSIIVEAFCLLDSLAAPPSLSIYMVPHKKMYNIHTYNIQYIWLCIIASF